MAVIDFNSIYKTINKDSFPSKMTITLGEGPEARTLSYEKAEWDIGGEKKGLRYGENPDQEAAMYRLVGGNLTIGEVELLAPGQYLASNVELLQSGKHPGKTNITDADAALNILRYLMDTPATVIVKHNNPCGVAIAPTLAESFHKAYFADRVAAFGGCVAVNRELDKETASQILNGYVEVVVAPSFTAGALEVLKTKPNVRVMEIRNMAALQKYAGQKVLDFKSLMDGGLILQTSFVPEARKAADFYPAQALYKGQEYHIGRAPTEQEMQDIIFGWLVEAGVTSNSVLYVKNGATVGIGTGEQDRVGVAEIARDKAYRKLEDRLCWERHQTPFNSFAEGAEKQAIRDEVIRLKGGLPGSVMVSDAFFPFRDGVDVGLREGVSAVVQPGGSLRDWEVIEACNQAGVAMVFTGQRSFRH